MDGVRFGGKGETLCLKCLLEVRDLNLPRLHPQRSKNVERVAHLLLHVFLDMLEVEICRDADHTVSDATKMSGKVFDWPIYRIGIFGIVPDEGVQEYCVVLHGAGEEPT